MFDLVSKPNYAVEIAFSIDFFLFYFLQLKNVSEDIYG
jgi:hypothetical protein